MTSLPRFSVNNPVLVNLFMVATLVGGVYSGLTLVREMFPEARPDQIMVVTLYPGATPTEVEKGITLKIEEQVKDIKGVEKVTSQITEGRSLILVEMRSGYDAIDQAVNDVKAAIDTIPRDDFPEEALESQVTKFEPMFPVIAISLFGDLDNRTLKTLGERLKEDVLALPGISDVQLSGTRKDEISVEIRPEKLVEFGLSFMEVAAAIDASNLDLPGGQVRTASINVAVRTVGEKDRGDELYDIVIRSDTSGRLIHLRDVATIIDGFEDVEVTGRFNAKPSISTTIYKTPEQDAVEIASMAKALVAGKMGRPLERPWVDRILARLSGKDVVREVYERALSNPYPPTIELKTRMDLSRIVSDRLDLLERNGMWGLLLVFLSLLVFLHWRVAFWVMMGLVLAITGSLICMSLLGQTLNLMTMGGFIIVLGLLVDDAIIVSEHVYSKVEQGMEPKLAAIEGTEEVTWPVVCAILTTIVAFAPLRFMEGQMGDWMGVLPVIVCIALTVSLVEALTVLPSHLAHNLRAVRPANAVSSSVATVAEGAAGATSRMVRNIGSRVRTLQESFQKGLHSYYERGLRLAATYRYVTMSGLFALLLVAGGMVLGGHVPWVLLQKMDSETLIVNLRMSVGTPIGATQEAVRVVEEAAMDLGDDLEGLYTLVGLQVAEDGMLPSPPQSHLAQSFIELRRSEERTRNSDDITKRLRELTTDIPGVEKLRFSAVHGGPGGEPIHLEIRGQRVEDLLEVSELIKGRLARFDGILDIVDDFDAGRPEVRIELFESARALGLTTQSLATQVRSAFYGFEARKVQRGREDVKIMVRYPQECRKHIHDVESMYVATPAGGLVPFTEVARMTEGTGFASIKRRDQQRAVTITADVDDSVTNADQVNAKLEAMFPEIKAAYPGIELEFGGQHLEMAKSFSSLKQNFAIALMLIFVILAGLFRSYVQPLIVMVIIPFGLIGAVAGHYLMDYPLTIASRIGIVALTGVVVNDAMVLVCFINRRIVAGGSAFEAVIEGGRSRLRPILLTSVTTVLGMGPLLLEQSWQAKFLIPMGISLSAGLVFATVLTLFAVPAMYLIILDLRRVAAAGAEWILGRPLATQ